MTNRFDGTPTQSAPGAAIPITYTNPAQAGHTVDIEVDDDAGNVTTLKITLDSAGKGTTTYTPPSGYIGSLGLNGPDSTEHQIIVTGPAPARAGKAQKKAPAKGKAKGARR